MTKPGYPVLDHLPPGVTILHDYRSQALRGLSLVECEHDAQVAMRGSASLICTFCKATGVALGQPVKLIAYTPKELTLL